MVQTILICKSLSLGEAICNLPMVSAIKQQMPDCRIIYLGDSKLNPLLTTYPDIDHCVDFHAWEQQAPKETQSEIKRLAIDVALIIHPHVKIAHLVKAAAVPIRVGNLRKKRLWGLCNHFVNTPRRHVKKHETQIDLRYLKALGLDHCYSIDEIIKLQKPFNLPHLQNRFSVDPKKFNLVIHPRKFSRCNKYCYPTKKYAQLIEKLNQPYMQIYITGSREEGELIHEELIRPYAHVEDTCGRLSSLELAQLLKQANAVIGASTGPLHLAAMLGIATLGIYPANPVANAQRWGGLGSNAQTISARKCCRTCSWKKACPCIDRVRIDNIYQIIDTWRKNRFSDR